MCKLALQGRSEIHVAYLLNSNFANFCQSLHAVLVSLRYVSVNLRCDGYRN